MFCEYKGKNKNGIINGFHYFVYVKIKRNKLYTYIEGLKNLKKPAKCYKNIETFLTDWSVIDIV